ncbi:hypothetical protein Tco_0772579 [Tanacetum coccineum]|uniref:Uncharacterized protein n=1 Tax=Tanacetum coccineum TaxID=301880 RepID=A0ABQ4ZM58_9ASTR
MCDVPLCNNPTSLNALNEHSEIVVNSDDDNSSSDDDSYENIDYVDASPPDDEIRETTPFDNSIPESETFRFNLEEISSGSPTTRPDLSLPDYGKLSPIYVSNDHFKEQRFLLPPRR